MVELEPGPLVEAPGARASGLAGQVLPIPFASTSADQPILSTACNLMGWSIRESTGLAGALVELFSGGSSAGELLATIALTAGFDPTASQTPAGQTTPTANAQAVATITPAAGVFAFITSLRILGLGATAAAVVNATLTGVQGGTITYPVNVPAGVTVPIAPVTDSFGTRGQAGSAAGQAISLTVPAFGAGNTLEEASITGYTQLAAGSGNTQGMPGPGLWARAGVFLHVVSGSVKGTIWVMI